MRVLLLLLALLAAACQDARPRIEGAVTVLHDVTVIAGTGAPPEAHQDVVLRGDRIAALHGTGSHRYDAAAEIIDLSGRFVLPGLIDTHAHVTILPVREDGTLADRMDRTTSEQVLRLLLAHGITTARNPAAPLADGLALRDAVAAGTIPGPRLVTAGEGLIQHTAPFGPFRQARTPEQIRAEVQRQTAAGVDLIKLYASLPPDLIAAAIDEAHAQGVPVVGHLQRTTWTEAARLGLDAITHGAPWSPAYLPDAARTGYTPTMKGRIYWLEHLDLNAPAVTEMLDALAAANVTIDPTLIAYHTKFFGNADRHLRHPEQHRVPAPILEGWQRHTFTDDWTPDDYRRAQAQWPKVIALTKRLHDRGVRLTAGSDLPNPWVIPGVSLHEELYLLADAGIPPGDVLRIATLNGAAALGLDGDTGSVEVGKRADLLVLAANPLDDLRHTRSIEAVVRGGRWLVPDTLLGR